MTHLTRETLILTVCVYLIQFYFCLNWLKLCIKYCYTSTKSISWLFLVIFNDWCSNSQSILNFNDLLITLNLVILNVIWFGSDFQPTINCMCWPAPRHRVPARRFSPVLFLMSLSGNKMMLPSILDFQSVKKCLICSFIFGVWIYNGYES